jgi:Cu(I)/Ag(I) efflux system membrane fusion protein
MPATLISQRGPKLASYAAVLAIAAIVIVPGTQAADPAPAQKMPAAPAMAVHKAEGVVRSIGDEIVIKHGPIPTMGMGAMTMSYKAPKGGLPRNVTPGTNVRFEFVMTPQGEMQLTSIVPAGGAGK